MNARRLFAVPAFAPLALGLALSAAQSANAASVWDQTVVHPLPTGRMLPGDRCRFGSSNCAGNGVHLGTDLMAPAGTTVVAMCAGVVRHNNTTSASIWNSKVIIEHTCGGHFQAQPVFGHYGHIQSSLQVGAQVQAGQALGTLKNDGANSHLHMGLAYSIHTSDWGYAAGTSDWLDFAAVVSRPTARPSVVAPGQGSAQGASVSFVWNPVAGATSYRMVLSRDGNPLRSFNNYTRTCEAASGGANSCWTTAQTSTNLTRELSPGAYYWVVRSDNADWSEIYAFTVGNGSGNATGATSWTSGVYRDNERSERVLSIAGASALSVSVQGRLENGYDFVKIFDAGGALKGSYTGAIQSMLTVQGSSVKVVLETDSSVVDSGVTVSISPATSQPNAPSLDPAAALIDACYRKYQQYFGAKVGGREDCFGSFVCQRTAGPVTMMAVEKPGSRDVLHYYWNGWNAIEGRYCRD